MSRRISFVTCEGGDWEGIYVDGILAFENHRLGPRDTLDALGLEFDRRCMSDEEMDRLGGHLPDLESSLDG